MTFLIFLILGFLQNTYAYQVECQDPGDCPGWIAGLSNGSGVCTSFLIKKNIMATNLHCIPQNLQTGETPNTSCKNIIRLSFPKTSKFEALTVDCDKVIYTSPKLKDGALQTDFAFIQLSQNVERELLELNQEGVPDLAKIQIVKVDPEQSKGIVRTVNCTASQNTPFNPYFQDNSSPLVLMYDCPIMKGNSGSPLVSSQGKAVGILSAMMDAPFQFSNFNFMKEKTIRTALGTNFACLNTFFLGYNVGYVDACQVSINEASQQKYRSAIMDKVHKQFEPIFRAEAEKSFNQFNRANSAKIQWRVQSRLPTDEEYQAGEISVVELEPSCFVSGPAPGSGQTDLSFTLPSFSILAGLDEHLKYKVGMKRHEKSVRYNLTEPSNQIKPCKPKQ